MVAEGTLSSLPSRGAWIEMTKAQSNEKDVKRRSPRGERGLKFSLILGNVLRRQSLPSRGAWIEIRPPGRWSRPPAVAPLAGSVD